MYCTKVLGIEALNKVLSPDTAMFSSYGRKEKYFLCFFFNFSVVEFKNEADKACHITVENVIYVYHY